MSSDNKRQGQEKPLGQLVKGIMKAYGLEDKLKSYDLIAAWPELMGPAVAQRTTDIRIEKQHPLPQNRFERHARRTLSRQANHYCAL
jgi:hypothetical protein